MSAVASQITSVTIVYWTVYSGADQRRHQSSASLAFVRGIHRRPVNSPHKRPVTRKMFPFDDVIMSFTAHVICYLNIPLYVIGTACEIYHSVWFVIHSWLWLIRHDWKQVELSPNHVIHITVISANITSNYIHSLELESMLFICILTIFLGEINGHQIIFSIVFCEM